MGVNKQKIESGKGSESEIKEYIDNTLETFDNKLHSCENFLGLENKQKLILELKKILESHEQKN